MEVRPRKLVNQGPRRSGSALGSFDARERRWRRACGQASLSWKDRVPARCCRARRKIAWISCEMLSVVLPRGRLPRTPADDTRPDGLSLLSRNFSKSYPDLTGTARTAWLNLLRISLAKFAATIFYTSHAADTTRHLSVRTSVNLRFCCHSKFYLTSMGICILAVFLYVDHSGLIDLLHPFSSHLHEARSIFISIAALHSPCTCDEHRPGSNLSLNMIQHSACEVSL
jgi:hypothetical protein